MKSDIDTIIFDLGAVLADHLPPRKVVNSFGLPYTDQHHQMWQQYKRGTITEVEFWKNITEGTTYQGRENVIATAVRDIFGKAKPAEAHPFVERLKEKGYNIAILSNHSKEWGWDAVKTLGLEQHCEPIIISADIGMAKPDREIYDYTLNAVQRKQEPYKCLFIDDKLQNIEAARKTGMYAVQFIDGKTLEKDLRRLGVLEYHS